MTHPFLEKPHRTFVSLSFPVLISLVAEPLTGLVDTGFVAQLGSTPLAALGVGTVVLSSIFWIFNFLSIGTQTEVAQALGLEQPERARQVNSLALVLSLVFGAFLIVAGWWAVPAAARLMGAEGVLEQLAVEYMRIRLFGAPAVLATIAAFGALRGLQEMKMPLWIALVLNAVNIGLDALLIFGWGAVPSLGVAGAAWASVLAQWVGAVWSVAVVIRRLGGPDRIVLRELLTLLQVGRDLFIRTGMLTLFLLLATRAATRIGPDAGAAHQAVRQVWTFTALFLDAFAIAGQSLVGFFVGARQIVAARRVAWVVCQWSVGTGVVLAVAMELGARGAALWLVPQSAWALFFPAWRIAALTQPLNAITFGTDGIHWGTGDFRYLRNAVSAATVFGALALWVMDEASGHALTLVWGITGAWILIRAVFGLLRIWPGLGRAPLALRTSLSA